MTRRGCDRHAALTEEGVEEIVGDAAKVLRVVIFAVDRIDHFTSDIQFDV